MTGATGFIGHRVARLLLERGCGLHLLVRSPHHAVDLQRAGARVFKGDIRDRKAVTNAMKGTDGLFHLAADYTIGTRTPAAMTEINVRGTYNVLTAMRDLRIGSGVYTSSIAINSDTRGTLADETYFFQGEHLSTYAASKWKAHYEVARPLMFEGLPLTIVIPSIVYGPGDHSIVADILDAFLRRRLPGIPGETMFSWAHVEDVALGHVLAMDRGRRGESYVLGGPSHSLEELFGLASRISRRSAVPVTFSPRSVRRLSRLTRLLEPAIHFPSYLSTEGLQMAAGTTHIADSSKAEEELGYIARSLESGLKGTLTDLAMRIARTTNNGRKGYSSEGKQPSR